MTNTNNITVKDIKTRTNLTYNYDDFINILTDINDVGNQIDYRMIQYLIDCCFYICLNGNKQEIQDMYNTIANYTEKEQILGDIIHIVNLHYDDWNEQ